MDIVDGQLAVWIPTEHETDALQDLVVQFFLHDTHQFNCDLLVCMQTRRSTLNGYSYNFASNNSKSGLIA